MGKRKKAAKPPPKAKSAKLDTVFDCLFCSHENTCEVFIDKVKLLGSICCTTCGAEHTSKINALEEAVDVYANWIDASVKEHGEESPAPQPPPRRGKPVAALDDDEDDDDDGAPRRRRFSDDDEDDADE